MLDRGLWIGGVRGVIGLRVMDDGRDRITYRG